MDNPYIPTRKTVKGLYMKAHVAGSKFRTSQVSAYADYVKRLIGEKKGAVDEAIENETTTIEKMLGIIEATEVNALVIDIKEDGGYVTWPTDIKGVADIQGNIRWILNIMNRSFNIAKKKGSTPSRVSSPLRIRISRRNSPNMPCN